jgi:protein-disulfide isomerase
MNRRAFLLGGGSLLALGTAYWMTLGSARVGLLPGAALAQEVTADAPAPAIVDMVMGSEDAKVVFLEFGSFTCPHCAAFHQDVLTPLKRDYIDTGKVKFVYRELVRNRVDIWASMLARCGGDMRYFGISDMLFTQQADWSASGDPATIAAELRKLGKVAGLDDAKLDVCMGDQALAQAILDTSVANAEKDSVTGTPTLFINGERVPNGTYEEFKTLIDAALAG